jgi:hypothetical protein
MTKNYCLVPENYKKVRVYNSSKLENFSDIDNVKEDVSFTHYIDNKDLATFFYIAKNETGLSETAYIKSKVRAAIKWMFGIFDILKLEINELDSTVSITLAYTADGECYNPSDSDKFFKNTIVTHQYVFNIYEKWEKAV